MPDERWVYRTDRVELDEQDEITDENMAALGDRLRKLGVMGWELSWMARGPHHLNAIFKQEMPKGPQPKCLAPPLIDIENAPVGTLLTCTQGTWDPQSTQPLTFVYQWTRDWGIPGQIGREFIPGATTLTYTTMEEDVGKPVHCFVVAWNEYSGEKEFSFNFCTVGAAGRPA